MRLLRSPLLHFLLAGGLLHLLTAAGPADPGIRVVEVRRSEVAERLEAYRGQMGRDPDEREAAAIERLAVEDALWLDQAFALGLHRIDPVVRQRLLQNMRFLGDATDESEEAMLARAEALGMDRSDVVVRRRLIERAQALVRARVRARAPDEAALAAHHGAHPERWREPERLDLSHVYLSRDRRGAAAEAEAERLLQRLRAESIEVDRALRLGDPFLSGHRVRGASRSRLAARLGPDFARAALELPVGRWSGPIESAFGVHLVWLHAREPSRVPPLAEVRKRVLEDWIEETSRRALRSEAERLRASVEVRWVEDDGAAG